MVEEGHGNLLRADAEALVNTVNTVGYMGKGIALQFKQAFPDNFKAYSWAVKAGDVSPGRMFVFRTGLVTNPHFIINFPTKRHWRGRSRMEDIDSGLQALTQEIRRLGIRSVAIPPLGCGNGGLDWREVRPRIIAAMAAIPEVRVLLFEPRGAPAPNEMPIGTRRPAITSGRAVLIKLMQQYSTLEYRLTLLEIQKLAYFLQEAGEPLRLRYEAGHYGPYAANLNNALERMEGHFVRGYGDSQKPDAEIGLLEGAAEAADAALATAPSSRERLARVGRLIEGFETPYGMELLSSVHWVAKHQGATTAPQATQAIGAWNERKRRMFSPTHIAVAWGQLVEEAWIPGNATSSGAGSGTSA